MDDDESDVDSDEALDISAWLTIAIGGELLLLCRSSLSGVAIAAMAGGGVTTTGGVLIGEMDTFGLSGGVVVI